MIHEVQLIAFHKTGLGVNVIFTDHNNLPYGWDSLRKKRTKSPKIRRTIILDWVCLDIQSMSSDSVNLGIVQNYSGETV